MDQDSRLEPERLAALIGLWSDGPGPLYAQLATAVERLVDTGVLRSGELLPPERGLATCLQVARGTVVNAYGLLAERGLVERTRGSGTRVATGGTAHFDGRERLSDPLFDTAPRAIDLLVATPSALPRVLRAAGAIDLSRHAGAVDDTDPAGIPALRERIADHITATGLPTTASQVLVTAGAQHAILLCTMLLTGPGDVVLCEETTWPGLVDNVARHGGRTHPVPMDAGGVVVDELRLAVERLRPSFIALNPHHHNPTGTRLTPKRRRQVAELAAAYGVPLVEDRVVSHLAFDGQVPAPLASEVPAGRDRSHHIVVDSISKTGWPGLRIGWLRADAQMVAQLRSLRALTDLYTPIHSQLTAISVLDEFDAVVADRVDQLRPRADRVLDLLHRELPDWEVARPRGGMVLWIRLPDGSAASFCEHAARHGVLIANGRQFGDDGDRHLRLPYTAGEAELDEGVRRLARAWQSFDRFAPTSTHAAVFV